jgi:hypothetical protein
MTDQSNKDLRHQQCSICSQLKDYERGIQVVGKEEQDRFVPEIAGQLKFVKTLKPGGCRYTQLHQCPECGTYYTYRTDYEYLAFGSEDEQILTRLTDEEGVEYLNSPEPDE